MRGDWENVHLQQGKERKEIVKFFKNLRGRKTSEAYCTHGSEEDYIVHRQHKKRRLYIFFPDKRRASHIARLLGCVVCLLVFGVSAAKLASYGKAYFQSRQASDALREIYHTEQSTASPTPESTATLPPQITAAPAPASTALPTATPAA